MSDDKSSSSADANALKALGLAAVGLVLGAFAFRLQLRGGDEKLFTYSLGLACSGFYVSSITQLAKALRATSTAQPGAPAASRVLLTGLTMTLVGVAVFTFSSVLANYLGHFEDPAGVEILIGLVAALLSFLGPILLGGGYFYWMQQSLCEAGWNIGAALIVATAGAAVSMFVWYALNVRYGPEVYHLIVS